VISNELSMQSLQSIVSGASLGSLNRKFRLESRDLTSICDARQTRVGYRSHAADARQKETGKFWRDRKVIPW